ncbi:MAG: hypothetical protein A2474_07805 [Elusimicrobia bacterium RIFOXYC2_FULL_34_12]|nr:MAG: hypothetical protein A2474_07805 [Elusimicrobia bacterium RIFOXYC2_FULL_34_12]
MKNIHIKLYHSYQEADKDSINETLKMKPEERIAAVNIIRRKIFNLKGINADNKVKKVISYGKR